MGVDLAAEPARTAVAWVDWSAAKVRLVGVQVRADDASIVAAIGDADKAGIDCPLGWPNAFVNFITAHQRGDIDGAFDHIGRAGRRNLALRATDRAVHALTGITPLSVSADRIGHTAMRCAVLMAELARRGHPVDRSGTGTVVEVYPAASLRLWGLPHRGYKRAGNLNTLSDLVDRLTVAAPWLDLGPHEHICRNSDDALDAVLAALTADFKRGIRPRSRVSSGPI